MGMTLDRKAGTEDLGWLSVGRFEPCGPRRSAAPESAHAPSAHAPRRLPNLARTVPLPDVAMHELRVSGVHIAVTLRFP